MPDTKSTSSKALARPAPPRAQTSLARRARERVGRAGSRVKAAGSRALSRVNNTRGGRLAVRGVSAVGRGVKHGARAVKENWKTIAITELTSLGSHASAATADEWAKPLLDALPKWLRPFVRPSTIKGVLEVGAVIFTRGKWRRWFRTLLQGTLHAKLGQGIASHFDSKRLGPAKDKAAGLEDVDTGAVEEDVPEGNADKSTAGEGSPDA